MIREHIVKIALPLLFASAFAGCAPWLGPTEPTLHEDLPSPGSIHLVAEPPRAPYPVVIRHMSGDDASGVYHEFAQGDTILIVFSNLPGQKGVQVNGRACEGRYTITTGVETDLLLVLGDGACRVEVIGSHAEGFVHTDRPTEPKVDGDAN